MSDETVDDLLMLAVFLAAIVALVGFLVASGGVPL